MCREFLQNSIESFVFLYDKQKGRDLSTNRPLCAHAHICMRQKLGLTYTNREEHSSVWEMTPMKILAAKRAEVTGRCRKVDNESLTISTPCQTWSTQVKDDLTGKASDMNGRQKKMHTWFWWGNVMENWHLENILKGALARTGMDWIYLAHDRD
jgi:hypothetical protein